MPRDVAVRKALLGIYTYQPGAKRMSKLLDQMRDEIRARHYSIRTEDAYLRWARKFILFHGDDQT